METDKPRLIAHRGGVTEGHGENSSDALEEAVAQGYFMIESDVRRTSDGHIVCYHDSTVTGANGEQVSVAELTLEGLTQALEAQGFEPPMSFAELCERCRGRIEVMLDMKPCRQTDEYFAEVVTLLRAHRLLDEALIIGTDEARGYFAGIASVAVSSLDQNGVPPDSRFLFVHGRDLQETDVERARTMEVRVVPSINRFHYRDGGRENSPRHDCMRLRHAGVRDFQIDSEFAPFLSGRVGV